MGKKKIVILGGGESGVGSAVLAKVKGFDVSLSDSGTIKPNFKQTLAKFDIEYEEGGHTAERILSADEVIKSPGIPEDNPMVESVREYRIPVISEIEFAGRYDHVELFCQCQFFLYIRRIKMFDHYRTL